MGKALSDTNKTADVHVAEIVHHGEKMILPEGLGIPEAIDLLKRRMTYLAEKITFDESFDVFPWDGAHALDAALVRLYGWAPATSTPGFFGDTPPALVSVEVGFNQVRQLTWGRFQLPNVEGYVQCAVGQKDGRAVFRLVAQVLRRDEEAVRKLFNELRVELKTNSIYRGKAVKIRFYNDAGEKLEMPEPKFLDTDSINESMLVYPAGVQQQVETNLFTPIERVRDCIANGISVKRGVLLGGTYGTGKTLAAHVASKKAVQNGITYLYVPRAAELAEAIEFAKQYQSPACVIFVEDIDREVAGERSVEMDDILNIIDGIDTKSSNLIVVMTSNDMEAINPAMLRPGRLDAVIEVLPPDAAAVEKLLRLYGGESIAAETDLSGAAQHLEGQIPAVIAEVIKRAKLAQLRLQEAGLPVRNLSPEALLEAAATMRHQLDLLARRSAKKPEPPTVGVLIEEHVRQALNGAKEAIGRIESDVHAVKERIL